MKMKLILASSSPRRAELLRDASIAFEVWTPQVDEARRPGESVEALVARLAEVKARGAAESVRKKNSAIVIGADTAVELNGELFGKPRDAAHAREILAALSGHTHHVLTGICVLRLPDGVMKSAVETTAVTFVPLDANEIAAYVASGEPFGKAGGYAIQGRAGQYIPRIEGCYFNVVGLPLARLRALLRDLGWQDDR
jgi:septum formation protein